MDQKQFNDLVFREIERLYGLSPEDIDENHLKQAFEQGFIPQNYALFIGNKFDLKPITNANDRP